MKKSLLVMAVLLTAVVFVKAQDSVTWIADDYCASLGLAADDIALAPGTEIVAGPLTLKATDGEGNGWKYKQNTDDPDFEYNGVPYKMSYVQGQTNPKDGRPTDADGNPAAATIWTATKDGRLDVTFKVTPRKRLWVMEIPTADLALHDIADSAANAAYKYMYAEGLYWWSGYIDPATNPPSYYDGSCLYSSDPVGDEYIYEHGLSLDIKVDNTYYLFVSGSKFQMRGFTFVAASGVSVQDHISNATVVSEEYFNVVGQKLSTPQFNRVNIVVKKMSDGSVKTEKTYIRQK